MMTALAFYVALFPRNHKKASLRSPSPLKLALLLVFIQSRPEGAASLVIKTQEQLGEKREHLFAESTSINSYNWKGILMVVFHWADNKSRRNCAHCAVQSPSADFELTTGGTFCEWLMEQLSSAEPGSVLLSITANSKQPHGHTHPTHTTPARLIRLLFHLHTQPLYPCKYRKICHLKITPWSNFLLETNSSSSLKM